MGSFRIGDKDFSPQEVVAQAKRAPGTLGLIAGLSAINSALVLFGAEISFIVGLGITAVGDGIFMVAREEATGTALLAISIILIAFNAAVIGVFLLLWWLARRGSRAAYIIACVLYGLDTFIYLGVQDWMGVGFHVFFLFLLLTGYTFVKRRAEAEVMLAEGGTETESAGPPSLDVAPPLPETAMNPESQQESPLEALWNALPGYRAQAQSISEAEGEGSFYIVLAKLGFARSEEGERWSDEHAGVLQHHLAIAEEQGDSETGKAFMALALGDLLGLHASGVLDDSAYHEGVTMLDEFIARKEAESDVA